MSISAQSITLQWDNGSVVFSQLSFHSSAGFHALVGRNGSGKSSLLHVLSGEHRQGGILVNDDIHRTGHTVLVAQNASAYEQSVAQYLGIEAKLAALERINAGSVEADDFELVDDDWLFKQAIEADMNALGFTNAAQTLSTTMRALSGGQQMRLRLLKAFQQNPVNLLLDEPSNHLDTEGRLWLRAQCNQFVKQPNKVLLVASHDRALLGLADWVHELSTLGLQTYQGNYADYRQQAEAESALSEAASRLEFIDAVSLPQPTWATSGNRHLLHCDDVLLPFGVQSRITFSLKTADKLRIQGANGAGKSVLLRIVEGRMSPKHGQLRGNYHPHVLDQHFSLLCEHRNRLDNLLNYNPRLTLTEARTHLAQVGLGSDKVMLKAGVLSGGERMKLALLMVMLAGAESTKPQLLILDEPDNHLDLQAKQQLAGVLRQYQGGILLVTHDDAFALDIGVTDTLCIERT
ncbi:ATP-binding cassette domain-containing protein [Aliidiomarina maris]|uniref:ATPase subunit of ABC transporter with duplicated ATPase domains n=1 Tax=Aliidiomarina maris TaxID=531312 RepID=A0A327WTS5_9GAMM|nr:ATP-binding cassette domain-containing protein [Aliidiomarina maris]RAJ94859.1 ATPase subunit of ABC transporter with duplicated ATPase domains [Aliidiomarina maris]RUO20538.1 hypothetical protein CWE07_12290 [Aliidiomarina maris]